MIIFYPAINEWLAEISIKLVQRFNVIVPNIAHKSA